MNQVSNPLTPLTLARNSHTFGWSRHWAGLLKVACGYSHPEPNDTIYWDHGVNFGGSLNLFGGVDDDMVDRIQRLVDVKPTIVSLDIPMPDYAEMLDKRLGQSSCSKKLTPKLIKAFGKLIEDIEVMDPFVMNRVRLTMGDSHSTAFSAANATIMRRNGKTLHGFLQEPLLVFPKRTQELTLVHGSIDIRHHIMRMSDPKATVKKLVNDYVSLAQRYQQERDVVVHLAQVVPVEHAERKVPKTGYYKGTPFTGTVVERQLMTQIFNETLNSKWSNVVAPPSMWYKIDCGEYAKLHMERGGSVHISPEFYRSQNWGL